MAEVEKSIKNVYPEVKNSLVMKLLQLILLISTG